MEKLDLEQVVMKDAVWAHITHETLREHYGQREQARYYGGIIADEIVKGTLATGDLWSCASWSGKLAREAATAAVVDTFESDESEEVLARRLLHSSVKTALKAVGTQRRLAVHRADYRRRCRLVGAESNRGLFQFEAHDLGLNGLDDLREQVTLKGGKI